jgi:hypothetical protein
MNPLRSNRIVGVAVMGGDCGTNRDPELLERDRRASWAALTKGRVPERMESEGTSTRGAKEKPRHWRESNGDFYKKMTKWGRTA